MSLLVDFLLILSVLFFFLGLAAIAVQFLRNKMRIRHYFLASVISFSMSLALAWDDVVAGWTSCGV